MATCSSQEPEEPEEIMMECAWEDQDQFAIFRLYHVMGFKDGLNAVGVTKNWTRKGLQRVLRQHIKYSEDSPDQHTLFYKQLKRGPDPVHGREGGLVPEPERLCHPHGDDVVVGTPAPSVPGAGHPAQEDSADWSVPSSSESRLDLPVKVEQSAEHDRHHYDNRGSSRPSCSSVLYVLLRGYTRRIGRSLKSLGSSLQVTARRLTRRRALV